MILSSTVRYLFFVHLSPLLMHQVHDYALPPA
jgi:hypothetical protein